MTKEKLKLSPNHANTRFARCSENLAAHYLTQNGWHILARNYRRRSGEIDIIASKNDSFSTVIAFIEVKSRRTPSKLPPQCAVTKRKQSKIIHAALAWISKQGALRAIYRFDIATITKTRNDVPRIQYFPMAFCPRQEFGW